MKIINCGIFYLEVDNSLACMNFNPQDPKYSEDLINSSFAREVHFLKLFSNFQWCPQNVEILYDQRKIYFDWFNNTCEYYLPSNWQNQLESIVKDLHDCKVYKPNFYMKNFYTDDKEILHAFVFYNSSTFDEQPISMDFYEPILNDDRLELVKKLSVNGKLDMKILIKYAFTDYIRWPTGILKKLYYKFYE